MIVDNLRIHHAKIVRAWAARHRDEIKIFYLPAYSPELNPDELVNGDLKSGVGQQRSLPHCGALAQGLPAVSAPGAPQYLHRVPKGRTITVVGSSGVGKSTFVNSLLVDSDACHPWRHVKRVTKIRHPPERRCRFTLIHSMNGKRVSVGCAAAAHGQTTKGQQAQRGGGRFGDYQLPHGGGVGAALGAFHRDAGAVSNIGINKQVGGADGG